MKLCRVSLLCLGYACAAPSRRGPPAVSARQNPRRAPSYRASNRPENQDAVTSTNHWDCILRKLPASPVGLRAPICPRRLARLESRLGSRLPEAYREFLQYSDGGWIGDAYIYGSEGLGQLLEGQAAARLRVLPFHPVDRQSVECLDLLDGKVLWWRDDRPALRRAWSFELEASRLHPAALEVVQRKDLVMMPTYEDFLDWALDCAMTAHRAQGQRSAVSVN